MVSKQAKKWREIKKKFHDELDSELCEGCGSENPVSMIRGFPVCKECFALIRYDNEAIFGIMPIPNDLNLHGTVVDRANRWKHEGFLKRHKELKGGEEHDYRVTKILGRRKKSSD